ncbi:MAG: hypothetical protein M1376_13495, partial [Planctomycetes bacterium]|nr:hypothetical protein [Planctomycetota bacterium]
YAGTYYYHCDGLGSVVGLTNASGNTVEVYEYDVYGRLGASDASHPNRLLFTGREYDKETGLYYYRARYYNAQIGRFLQTDPVGYGAGMNWYAYCGNNSTNAVDPSGLLTIYVYLAYGEGVDFFYELTDVDNGPAWNLEGVADWMAVDPNRLEAADFGDGRSGYVIHGMGDGYSSSSSTMGKYKLLSSYGPVAYTPLGTGPLGNGAPTRISSEPVDASDGGHATSGGVPTYAGGFFPSQMPNPGPPILPIDPGVPIFKGGFPSKEAAAAWARGVQMGLGSTGSQAQPPAGPGAALLMLAANAANTAAQIGAQVGKGAAQVGAAIGGVVMVGAGVLTQAVAPTQCTCGTNVRCRLHPRGPGAMEGVLRSPVIEECLRHECEHGERCPRING